jgi:cleavage and polyadenylation specificity factor subunit 5
VQVNEHNHPHVLLLQSGGGGAGGGVATFKLPGGRLRHGEGEVEGLQVWSLFRPWGLGFRV